MESQARELHTQHSGGDPSLCEGASTVQSPRVGTQAPTQVNTSSRRKPGAGPVGLCDPQLGTPSHPPTGVFQLHLFFFFKCFLVKPEYAMRRQSFVAEI